MKDMGDKAAAARGAGKRVCRKPWRFLDHDDQPKRKKRMIKKVCAPMPMLLSCCGLGFHRGTCCRHSISQRDSPRGRTALGVHNSHFAKIL